MLGTVLAIFMIGGMACWGQTQSNSSSAADKVDHATAYYHYALAHKYAKLAAASGCRNREYMNKAIENYEAAIKADPLTPLLGEELSKIRTKQPLPSLLAPVPRPPSN